MRWINVAVGKCHLQYVTSSGTQYIRSLVQNKLTVISLPQIRAVPISGTVLITDPAPRKRTQELSGTEAGCQYASVDTQSFSPVSHVFHHEGQEGEQDLNCSGRQVGRQVRRQEGRQIDRQVSKVHVRQDRTLTVQSFRDLHQYHAGHLLHGQRGGGSLPIDGC